MANKNKKIIQYQELRNIRAGENNDPLVVLAKAHPEIVCRYQKKDMLAYVGNNILVRKKLGAKLALANKKLNQLMPGARLKVVYGYRHPLIQNKYFNQILKSLKTKYKNLDALELVSLAHNFVAAPDVAGHTTGGAVDITIEYQGRELDLGTKIADFKNPEKIKTFSSLVTKQQTKYRQLLKDLLLAQGLAPFYGEWWHFSYGDKEWACFYKKKKSLYSEIEYTS